MTDAPDYAKLVEELNNFADTLDNDAEDARAAEAEEAQANAEEWAALQRTSAAAITALLRERDDARESQTDAREHIAHSKQTIAQLLRYYAATTHFPREARTLFARGAAEIERLDALLSPVTCLTCKRQIERADEWFRCFDCGMTLCRDCTSPHFGAVYSKHHASMADLRSAALEEAAKVADAAGTDPSGEPFYRAGFFSARADIAAAIRTLAKPE